MPIHVAGGSSNGNSELALAKREDWRKYRWESREEYMNNQWHVDQYGSDFGKRRHSEHLTMSTLDYMGLPEAFLGNYYIEVSTFSAPEREHKYRITACHPLISLIGQR